MLRFFAMRHVVMCCVKMCNALTSQVERECNEIQCEEQSTVRWSFQTWCNAYIIYTCFLMPSLWDRSLFTPPPPQAKPKPFCQSYATGNRTYARGMIILLMICIVSGRSWRWPEKWWECFKFICLRLLAVCLLKAVYPQSRVGCSCTIRTCGILAVRGMVGT